MNTCNPGPRRVWNEAPRSLPWSCFRRSGLRRACSAIPSPPSPPGVFHFSHVGSKKGSKSVLSQQHTSVLSQLDRGPNCSNIAMTKSQTSSAPNGLTMVVRSCPMQTGFCLGNMVFDNRKITWKLTMMMFGLVQSRNSKQEGWDVNIGPAAQLWRCGWSCLDELVWSKPRLHAIGKTRSLK